MVGDGWRWLEMVGDGWRWLDALLIQSYSQKNHTLDMISTCSAPCRSLQVSLGAIDGPDLAPTLGAAARPAEHWKAWEKSSEMYCENL